MALPADFETRIQQAWAGRISGCMLGKAVEVFSMREGHAALTNYLNAVQALPLRDYIPYHEGVAPPLVFEPCCHGRLQHSIADDDINYSLLALMLLEQHGAEMTTTDVARAWLKYLPLASTFTAERAAYKTLLSRGKEWFPEGAELGFDISECAANPYNDWIGAQIRADLYGWVCPGQPDLAAQLVTQDAALSHQGDGVFGAVYIAVLGAYISAGMSIEEAIEKGLNFIPADSRCSAVVQQALKLQDSADGGDQIRSSFGDMSAVHTVNNLGLVVWALSRYADDFAAAIGDVVAAGLDTDCNGATVGALWGLQGKAIPSDWTAPWNGRIGVSLAGHAEVQLPELVARTVAVAEQLKQS